MTRPPADQRGLLPAFGALLLLSLIGSPPVAATPSSAPICSQRVELVAHSGLKQALSGAFEALDIATSGDSPGCQPAELKASATEALLVLELTLGETTHRRDDLHDLKAVAEWVQSKLPPAETPSP